MKKLILITALLLVACEDVSHEKNYSFLKCDLKDSTITFENIINNDNSLVLDHKKNFDRVHKDIMNEISKENTTISSYYRRKIHLFDVPARVTNFDVPARGTKIHITLLAVNKTFQHGEYGTKLVRICKRDLGMPTPVFDEQFWNNEIWSTNRFFADVNVNECPLFEVKMNKYERNYFGESWDDSMETIGRQNLTHTIQECTYEKCGTLIKHECFCDLISYEELKFFENKLNSIFTEIVQYNRGLIEIEDKYKEEIKEDIRRRLSEKNKI